MTFIDFVDYVRDHIKEHLPQEYTEAEIRIEAIQKMSEQYTGMIIKPEGVESVPVANMDMFYGKYLQNESLDEVISEISGILQTEIPPELDPDLLKDYEKFRDKLFVRISPAGGCEKIMAESPHRKEEDLLMTYHILIPGQDMGFLSARVTNEMIRDLDVEAKQLHEDALANTGKLFPVCVRSMMEALTGIKEDEPSMIVISNDIGTYGASALFCEGVLDQVSGMMHGNYYLLPSSVHEWIAVPDDGSHQREDLEKMVISANRTVVEPEDKLSDGVFHYDAQERLFERADKYEKRVAARDAERSVEKGSLLGKLDNKREQMSIGSHGGREMHRQPGMAI